MYKSSEMPLVKSDRPLAEIKLIEAIKQIENADEIEIVQIEGWEVVVRKTDNFKRGDKCVYVSLDAVFPSSFEKTAFLEGKPLKTKKIRGIYSQGLVFPLEWIKDLTDIENLKVDDDVTDVIGILKWISEDEKDQYIQNSDTQLSLLQRLTFWKSSNKSNTNAFPSHIVAKTDEKRIQKTPQYLKEIQGQQISVSRKEDGSSMTIIYTPAESFRFTQTQLYIIKIVSSVYALALQLINSIYSFEINYARLIIFCSSLIIHYLIKELIQYCFEQKESLIVCSRNYQLKKGDVNAEQYFTTIEKLKIKEKLSSYGKAIVLQGELVGPKINGNRLQLTELDFRVFSIFDSYKQAYVSQSKMVEICKELNINTVPILYNGIADERFTSLKEILKYTESILYAKGVYAEGIVVRVDKESPRISFKVISNKYLMKHEL